MAKSLINLDEQSEARIFPFGGTGAGQDALVTINKGTAATSAIVLDVKGSASIAGDLTLVGNLLITGSINEQSVTNLAVTDTNIILNKGGTTSGAADSGLIIEGTSGAQIGKLVFDNTLASKWKAGNGTTQIELVDLSSVQTLTNKNIGGSQISGNISGNAANITGVLTAASSPAYTGDVTKAQGSLVTSISANSVTYGKMQAMTANKLLGSGASGTAVSEITLGAGFSFSGSTLNFAGNSGTVTSISIVTANGISGTVATATTTPAITLTLGAITPSSVAATGTVTGSNLSGTNTGDQTITLTGDATGSGTGTFAVTLVKYSRVTTVSGTQDGANKVFTIGNVLKTGSEQVFLNGQLLQAGSTNDYIYDGVNTITFQAAQNGPKSSAVIKVYGVY
jgi:hypothetical protein